MFFKKASYIFYCLFFTATFFAYGQGGTKVISSGSYVINMGVEPQTVGNALKPYGLVYKLVSEYKIPVIWSISSTKQLDGVDFTYNNTGYKGGPFIIESKFLSSAVLTEIAAWEAKGVVGVTTTSEVTVPVYEYIVSAPKIFILNVGTSLTTGLTYINNNAGITSTINSTTTGSLDPCTDLVTIFDADIVQNDINGLYDFVINGGNVFVQGKSASILEGLNSPIPGLKLDLLTFGLGLSKTHISDYTSSISYNTSLGDEPIVQFLGENLHIATDNYGISSDQTETWYIPEFQWRATTQIPVKLDTANTAGADGAKVAYGQAYGENSYGRALYVAGNDLDGSTNEQANVSAQRLLLNFILQTGIDNSGTADLTVDNNITDSSIPENKLLANQAANFTANISGISATSYSWYSSCGGTFTGTGDVVSFTPENTNSRYSCEISVVASDNCGHAAFSTTTFTVYPQNDAPETQQDDVLSIGNQPLTIDVLANDSDAQPDDQLTINAITQQPVNGTVNIVGNQLQYTGDNNTYVMDSLYYQVCDDGLNPLCSEARVIITNELMINSAPVVNNQSFTVTAGQVSELCVTGTDAEDDALEITSVSIAGVGTVNNDSPGDLCFTYEVAEDFTGTETVDITVCDIRENYLCTSATITIDVLPPNNPPIVSDQTFEAIAGELVSYCVDASDPDGDGIQLTITDTGSSGADVVKNANPNNLCFNYKAPHDFSGTDTFNIEICDDYSANPLCTSATITMNVRLPNAAPEVEDQTFNAVAGVLTNFCVQASDPEGDSITMELVGSNSTFNDDDPTDLCFEYQSAVDFSGTDQVTIEICDYDADNPQCTRAVISIVVGAPSIEIGKAVTPDGNGQNDVFYIQNIESYPNATVRIFDRYGGLIFETSGYRNDTNNWNGYNSTKEAPAGTYFYYIELPKTGEKFKGYVELIK